jgi:hypothetical protein
MLPFNGDETYIAGGILPRTVMNDGSSEATLLFIKGAEEYLKYRRENHPDSKNTAALKKAVREAKEKYLENFVRGGRLAANNPERRGAPVKKFLHGVCLDCRSFGWMQSKSDGYYYCAKCYDKDHKFESRRYFLYCVTFMHEFVSATVLPKDLMKSLTEEIAREFNPSGKTVGYEYGFALRIFMKYGMEKEARETAQRLIKLTEGYGAWIEYYHNGEKIPDCCQYRPWESAINMEALYNYATSG